MNRIFSWLNEPYPVSASFIIVLRDSFLYGLFVFLFLLSFQPFGLDSSFPNKLVIISGYGAVTTLIFPLFYLVGKWIFPDYFRAENWKVGRQLFQTMSTLLLIALANAGYTIAIGIGGLHPKVFLFFAMYTLAVGIFPTTIAILLIQIRKLRNNNRTSQALNENLRPSPTPLSISIALNSTDGKMELELPFSSLLFIRSADNYVEVVYSQGDQVQKKLIRSSLKGMADQLAAHPNIERCHRSYIVNLDAVTRWEGNAAGLRLHLQSTDETIPVSRSAIPHLRQRLAP